MMKREETMPEPKEPEAKPKPPYRIPTGGMIGRSPGVKKLYELEEARDTAIRAAAEELQRVLGLQDFWREAMPEALLAILEAFDQEAAKLAAKAYLAGPHNS